MGVRTDPVRLACPWVPFVEVKIQTRKKVSLWGVEGGWRRSGCTETRVLRCGHIDCCSDNFYHQNPVIWIGIQAIWHKCEIHASLHYRQYSVSNSTIIVISSGPHALVVLLDIGHPLGLGRWWFESMCPPSTEILLIPTKRTVFISQINKTGYIFPVMLYCMMWAHKYKGKNQKSHVDFFSLAVPPEPARRSARILLPGDQECCAMRLSCLLMLSWWRWLPS